MSFNTEIKRRVLAERDEILSLVHYMKHKIKDPSIPAIPGLEQKRKSRSKGKYPNKNPSRRWVVTFNKGGLADNLLLRKLHYVGFFLFYTTNNGFIVNVSQISYFLHIGYRALARGKTAGKDVLEIHHIDGNVENDTPTNLIGLSTGDHHLVSACQNGTFQYDEFFWQSHKPSNLETPFNNQGRSIKNRAKFLDQVISQTLKATQRWLDKIQKNLSAKVKQTVSWVLRKLHGASLISVEAIKQVALHPLEAKLKVATKPNSPPPPQSSGGFSLSSFNANLAALIKPIKPLIHH